MTVWPGFECRLLLLLWLSLWLLLLSEEEGAVGFYIAAKHGDTGEKEEKRQPKEVCLLVRPGPDPEGSTSSCRVVGKLCVITE